MRMDPIGASNGVDNLLKEEIKISSGKSGDVNQSEKPQDGDISEFVSDFKKKLKEFHEIFKGELQFVIDRDINMIIVKIKDKETGEIIRQIPPEVVVKLAKALDEFLGLLMDERV